MTSKLRAYFEFLMEACWLAAVAIIPLFFNISSMQIFEPDKIFLLRFLAVISLAAWMGTKICFRAEGGKIGAPVTMLQLCADRVLGLTVLFLILWFTISSIFSVVPVLSWWGSYQRAQGATALYCYGVFFLVISAGLRTFGQFRRLQLSFILGSLPVTIYAILQHFNADFLHWSNPIPGRVSAGMGNPIFLGAYLIMVIPLTFDRFVESISALRSQVPRAAAYLLSTGCAVALILQVLALFFTQSRGPAMGLAAAAYMSIFVWLLARRRSASASLTAVMIAVLAGLILPLAAFYLLRITLSTSLAKSPAVSLGLIAGLVVLAYILLERALKMGNLLWLTWLIQALVIVAITAAGAVRLSDKETGLVSSLGRWTQLSDDSARVRQYLWQTGWAGISSSSPAILEGGRPDRFYPVRFLIGYGPESMGFIANRYAVSELVRIHSREAVDRMHNEIFDHLLQAGVVGASSFLTLFALAFFYALRFLGFFQGKGQTKLFIIFALLGCIVGVVVPWVSGVPHFCGVGMQAGLLVAVFGLVARQRPARVAKPLDRQQQFALFLLAALTAHIVAIGVGIGITCTRLYFFVLLAILSVIAGGKLSFEQPTKTRPARQQVTRNPLWAYATITCFLAFALSWCFVINTEGERDALRLFFHTWFSPAPSAKWFLPGAMPCLLMTILGGIGLVADEAHNFYQWTAGKRARFWPLVVFPVLIWLLGGVLSAAFWTALDPHVATPVNVASQSESRIILFLSGILILLLSSAYCFMKTASWKNATLGLLNRKALFLCIPLGITAFMLLNELTIRPARADAARRIGRICEDSGDFRGALEVYRRAVMLAPRNISYRLSLGFAAARAGLAETDAARKDSMLDEAREAFQQAITLNPLDPASHVAAGSFYVQVWENSSNTELRNIGFNQARSFFRQAAELAPDYPEAYIQLGRCYFLLGEVHRAAQLYQEALRLNPRFARTHMFIGEMHYRQQNLELALQSFSEAARLSPRNVEAKKNVGFLLALLGRKQEAIQVNLQALAQAPGDIQLLRRLAVLYFDIGDYNSGRAYARRAYEATPGAAGQDFDSFLNELLR